MNESDQSPRWGTVAACVLAIAAVLFIVGGYLVSDKMDRTSNAVPGTSTGQSHQAEPNTLSDRTSKQEQPGRQGSGISGDQTTNVPPASR
jgi:hypothetical protein